MDGDYPPETDGAYTFYCKICGRDVSDLPYYHDKERDILPHLIKD